MPSYQTSSSKLAYEFEGKKGASTLMLLSGFAADRRFWEPLKERLGKQHRLLLVDNPGIGESTLSAKPNTRNMASAIGELLDHLAIDNLHVLGHGIGGMMAQWLAVDCPQHVTSLTLYSTCARPVDTQPMAFNGKLFAAGQAELALENIARWSFSPELCEDQEAFAAKISFMKSCPPAARDGVQAQLKAYASHDASKSLKKIKAPTIVIGGDRDRIAMEADLKELATGIPGATLKVFPGMGNSTHVELPKAFCACVIEHTKKALEKKTKAPLKREKRKADVEATSAGPAGMFAGSRGTKASRMDTRSTHGAK